jgi:Ca2+-binding RTX toxin-like protein
MGDLVDVIPGAVITSERQNDINDYIAQGTHGINTLSVVSAQSITGAGYNYAKTVQTSTYVALVTDDLIICNSSIAFTVTLPVASGTGKRFAIKNINTGVITVDGNSNDTIDGLANQTVAQWQCIEVVDYVANKWVIV